MWKLINNCLGSKAKELPPPEKLFDSVNITKPYRYLQPQNNGQCIQQLFCLYWKKANKHKPSSKHQ